MLVPKRTSRRTFLKRAALAAGTAHAFDGAFLFAGVAPKAKLRTAVIGCGGAGRAIASALVQSGAGVTLINRGAERGHHASKLLGLPYIPLPDFSAEGYDIIVNATPVGRDSNEVPFKLENLNDEAVVIDLVYGARPTPLIANSLAREQIAIDGRDVLLTQVVRQFRMMTGKEMPVTIALNTLGRQPVAPDVVHPGANPGPTR